MKQSAMFLLGISIYTYSGGEYIPVIVNIHTTNDASAVAVSKPIQVAYSFQTLSVFADLLRKGAFSISRYKRKILGICTLSGISAIYYHITQCKKRVCNVIWSQWKSHIALHNLAQVPQNELARELIMDIHRKYVCRSNPIDSLYPLTTFIQALEKEQKIINEYRCWHIWCVRLYLSRFFPLDQNLFDQTTEQLQRVEYVQQIFTCWAAQQNFDSCK